MNTGRKQFAVYRLKQGLGQMEVLRYRSWNFIQKYCIRVTSEHYEQICISPFSWDFQPEELRRQLENGLPASASGDRIQISDVLVITKDRDTTAYYVDPDRLIIVTDFFHTTASTSLLSIDTTDYQIKGRPGNWLAADEIWIDGQHFFLMQSQEFGKNAAYAVLDSNGDTAAEDTIQGFSEEVIRQIRRYMERQNTSIAAPERKTAAPLLENWQKSYENGEYLRSAEMTEEQNYSMIDGRMNNMPPKGSERQKPIRKRRKGKLPLKGRESVLKRLRDYQNELTAKGNNSMSQDAPELQERRKA